MTQIFLEHSESILVLVLLGTLIAPTCVYLLTGWVAKREEILSLFSDHAIELYYCNFFPKKVSELSQTKGNAWAEDFREHYETRFGRHHYIIPGICFVSIAALALFTIQQPLSHWLHNTETQLRIPNVAVAAIAGAYMWVLYDLIGRARRRDLSPTDLFWGTFRFIVATPMGLAFSSIIKEEVGVAIAFMLGAFPTHFLFTLTRRVVTSKYADIGGYSEESGRELEELQGISRTEGERFGDEGVRTVLQLAYSDPVGLTMRTNFRFDFVLDCCSQALAWIYFELNLRKMRVCGLRGAMEIDNLYKTLKSEAVNDDVMEEAEKALQEVSRILEIGPDTLKHVMGEISGDPYVEYLSSMWQESAPSQT